MLAHGIAPAPFGLIAPPVVVLPVVVLPPPAVDADVGAVDLEAGNEPARDTHTCVSKYHIRLA
jgi:hypothetical protein